MTTKKTRAIKSVQKGLLSFLIQPFYLMLMLALPETIAEESLLGYLLVYLFMLPLLPGFVVAALVSGENIHSNEMLIAVPAGLAVKHASALNLHLCNPIFQRNLLQAFHKWGMNNARLFPYL